MKRMRYQQITKEQAFELYETGCEVVQFAPFTKEPETGYDDDWVFIPFAVYARNPRWFASGAKPMNKQRRAEQAYLDAARAERNAKLAAIRELVRAAAAASEAVRAEVAQELASLKLKRMFLEGSTKRPPYAGTKRAGSAAVKVPKGGFIKLIVWNG